MAVGLVIIGTGPGPWLATVAAALLGFGFSFPWASVASTVLRSTPESQHGATIGFLSACNDLFVGLSSLAAGFVADRFGYGLAFDLAAIALLPAALAARFLFSQKSVSSTDEERQPAMTAVH
jgi:MFS family permease